MTDLAIETQGLRKAYREVVALDALALEVPAGSVYGFLGPNGAGKTTTMKILLGLIRPSDGAATMLGHDVARDGVAARRAVGYLAQDARFHPYRTVRGVVNYVAHLVPGAPRGRDLHRRVDELLDQVGMAGKARRRSGVLSGGERQRLGLAAALVAEPELLVLDEPAAGLDPEGRHGVLDLIEQLRGGTTVFFSTHLLDDVQRVSDTVGVVADGRTIAEGPLDDILEAPAAAYTVRLRGATDPLLAHLRAQPWVAGVDDRARGEQQLWEVQLADPQAGAALLDAAVDAEAVDVIEFHPTDPSLELAYLELVGAEATGSAEPAEAPA